MANENTPETKTADGFPDLSKENAEVAAKLAAQGQIKVPDATDLVEPAEALDKLAKEKFEKANADEESAKKKVADDAAAKKAAEEAANDPASKAEAEKKAAEAAAEAQKVTDTAKKAEDFFKDSPGLPAGASPKSAEAFSSIKIKAAQEISARDQKLDELTKQLTELKAKLEQGDPATQKELDELREWRAKLDVDADPKFAQFDKQVSQSQEFIYAQLRKSPVITDEIIAEIKKHGGPEFVNMAKIFTAVNDPTLQRIVESRIADIEQTKFNRAEAIKATKENIGKYLEERQKSFVESATAHNIATKKIVDELKGKMEWFKETPIDEKADEPMKAAIKAQNEFVVQTQKNLDAALQDDSTEMRAIMLVSMAQLFQLQRVHGALKAAHDKQSATVKELTEKIEKLKSASVNRMKESGAPPSGQLPAVKKDTDFNTPATVAIDEIARDLMEKRRAAAGTA